MIQLEETTDEYLLQIHAREKERARKIPGRRWDARRKRWVFPKNPEVLDQLLIEFGDDLEISTRPYIEYGPDEPYFSKEDYKIFADIDAEFDRSQFEKYASFISIGKTNVGEFIKQQLILYTLRTRITILRQLERAKDAENAMKENTDLWQEIDTILKSNDSLSEALGAMESNNKNLQNEITKLQLSNESISETRYDFDKEIRKKAISCAGSDPDYSKMIEQMTLGEKMPTQLEIQMVRILKKILNLDERERPTTFELIQKADEEEKIPPESVDFAHIIRRQRNAIVHGDWAKTSLDARIILSLFASALLWPNLKVIGNEIEKPSSK